MEAKLSLNSAFAHFSDTSHVQWLINGELGELQGANIKSNH